MNCIILDDEPLARAEMQSLIREVSNLEILGDFSNALTAVDFLKTNQVDLIFLDIQMPLMTGLEFAESLPKQSLIIFTTAYSQYALKSYELDAIDYLLKPIEKQRLEKAIYKAELLKDYVVIHTKTQKLITAMNLKTIHQKIPADIFLRVSKSFVINLNFIDSFDKHNIYIDESEIPLGEVYKSDFFEAYSGGSLNLEG